MKKPLEEPMSSNPGQRFRLSELRKERCPKLSRTGVVIGLAGRSDGCDVISAKSGADALDQLKRNERITILITDISMPGMDGHELDERARRIRPEVEGSPTIRSRASTRRLSDDQKAFPPARGNRAA